MRPINQKQDQKEISPNRLNPDLYILSYPQNDINLIPHPKTFTPTLPSKSNKISQQPISLASTRKETKQGIANVTDRWKNIDRLVQMLKRGSKSKDKDDSACSRLFKLVEKMYARFWRKYSRQIKLTAFKNIKTKAETPSLKPWMLNLKESLEMKENQIQKGSKNFEINDLMNIINLHQNEANQNKLKNSLSRQLILKNAASKDKPSLSPKKGATNVYILRRKTKEDLSTRQDLNSNTHISSQQFLPNGTQVARSISPHSVDRSKSPNSIKDEHIDLPSARNSALKDNKLQQLEIDSVKLDKSQQNDQQQRENISNIKLPSFGIYRRSQVAANRPNRLMNLQTAQRKIVFHYRDSEQRSTSPLRNEYFPPETTAKFMIPRQVTPKITQQTPILALQKVINPNVLKIDRPVTRLQRISSLQALHPKSIISNQAQGNQNNQNNVQLDRKYEGSVESRRCYSMPKITFTYKSKEEIFVNPTPHNLQKNSPIFVLNQLKSNASGSKQQHKVDPYLSKNIEVNNVFALPNRHQLIHPAKHLVYAANALPENYYNMPVNNFPPVNHGRTERFKIFSNHQTQPTNSFFSNQQQAQREEYYGSKQIIRTQDTLPSPHRLRVMSTDTYILTRPKPIQQQVSPKKQNIAYAMIQRERARSCGIKMEVVSRKLPMIRVN